MPYNASAYALSISYLRINSATFQQKKDKEIVQKEVAFLQKPSLINHVATAHNIALRPGKLKTA
jgi:hypothetical protein